MRAFLERQLPDLAEPDASPQHVQAALYCQGLIHHDSHSRRGGVAPLARAHELLGQLAADERREVYMARLQQKQARVPPPVRISSARPTRVRESWACLILVRDDPRRLSPRCGLDRSVGRRESRRARTSSRGARASRWRARARPSSSRATAASRAGSTMLRSLGSTYAAALEEPDLDRQLNLEASRVISKLRE